jgi:formylglycine-generating enzyme
MSQRGNQRERELEEPYAAQGPVSVFGRRKLFAVVSLTGIAAAASFLGCGGETAGNNATANGTGVTGGIHSTSTHGSMSTGGVAVTGGTTSTGGVSGASGCPGTGGPTMVRLPEGYCIDSTEVTRSQYQAWLATNPSTAGQTTACTWKTIGYRPPPSCMSYSVCQTGCDDQPQVCVDWCDAYAYCQGVGKRLCGKIGGGSNGYGDHANASLSQWYNACVSDGANNRYPYGNTRQPGYCNGADHGVGTTVPVGSLDNCQSSVPGYVGVYDLSGNVAEWEDSCQWTGGTYAQCRVRGGSCDPAVNTSKDVSCGADASDMVNDYGLYIGFRCCSP